jgi:phage/plasmid-associated DNA primase
MSEKLSGILNFGLKGLAKLRSNGWRFTYEDDAASVYRRKSKQNLAFLEDICEQPDEYVTEADLLAAYKEYAKQMGLLLAASKAAFSRTMMDKTVIPLEMLSPKVGDKLVEAWSGIKLTETTQEKEEKEYPLS